MNRSKCGFTLIELSLVLVIIGLLAGGVLVGKDLIYTATLRSVITDVEKINTAVMAFRGKYNCLPGDCTKATDFFGKKPGGCADSSAAQLLTADGTTCNGDGNGVIKDYVFAGSYASITVFGERQGFWQQLLNAGLYAPSSYYRPGVSLLPKLKLNGSYLSMEAGEYFIPNIGAWTDPSDGNVFRISSPGLTGFEAFYLDSKMDDGKPASGETFIPGGPSFILAPLCATTDDPVTAEYNMITTPNVSICQYFFITSVF